MFENNLRAEGLELEQEINQEAGLHFVKIHAPLDILKRYAEVLKLQMPVKNVSRFINLFYRVAHSLISL